MPRQTGRGCQVKAELVAPPQGPSQQEGDTHSGQPCPLQPLLQVPGLHSNPELTQGPG